VTAWNPEWRVTINGSTLTNVTLADLAITSGRTSIYEQPTASYANINLIVTDQSNIAIDINDTVTIEIKKSNGSFVYLYGGFVSDFSKTINRTGSVGYSQTFSILALGALARLPRQLTEGVLSKDQDGDQIYSILEGTLFNSWAEVAPTLTWADYDSTETWANAENVGLGEIDRPGNYELIARSASTTDVYSLVTQLANSGLGIVYENAQGQICYADSTHRGEYLATNGYVDLDAQQAIAPGLRVSTRGQDVRNSITVTYKNNQQVSAEDAASIALYGLMAQNFETVLDLQADAEDQADFYLELRAYPQGLLEAITFEIGSPDLDNSDRDALLGIFIGMPVNLANLPINMGSNFQGFVEGWTFQARFNALSVSILMSPIAYSLQAFRWTSVPVGETWNTISPTLTWLEATIVA